MANWARSEQKQQLITGQLERGQLLVEVSMAVFPHFGDVVQIPLAGLQGRQVIVGISVSPLKLPDLTRIGILVGEALIDELLDL